MGKYKMQNRSSLPKGYQLNKYKIEKFLGQGGFGIAYLAKEIASNKKVVIKESFSKYYVFRGNDYGVVLENNISLNDYRSFLDKFFLEAKIINSINHPNIVRVIDSFETNNTAYFIMEYIEGESLLNHIQKNGSLSLHQIYLIIAPLLQGLKEVHKKGYIHRDISPDNILIQPNGVPILIDFGIAKNIDLMGSNSSNSIVKNGYSPFEQYSKTEKPKASMDIYALGATLFLMMAKQVPTSSVERQNALNNHKKDPLQLDLLRWRTQKYSKLVPIIEKAMAFNSKERYQSIDELQSALFEERAKKSFFSYLKEIIFSSKKETIKSDFNNSKQRNDKLLDIKMNKELEENTFVFNGLMWEKKVTNMNWYEATEYAKNLNIGGYNDWRLPKKEELKEVIKNCGGIAITYGNKNWNSTRIKNVHNNNYQKCIEDKGFTLNWYWSCNEYNISDAWSINFYDGGSVFNNKSHKDYILCVREL